MRLLESNAPRQRRRGGMAVSAVVHAALIVLAVVTTGGATVPEEHAGPPERAVWVPPRAPDPAPVAPRTPAPPRGEGAPGVPVPAPPPIDLSRIPDGIAAPGAPPVEFDPARGLFDAPSRPLAGDAVPSGGGGAAPDGPLTGREVDREVALVGAPPRPRYPEALRAAGVDGRVVMRFVVDTAGRVERGSVTLVAASHPLFAAAVEATLARLRFRPAEAAGRRVRQLVEMPFEFVLSGR